MFNIVPDMIYTLYNLNFSGHKKDKHLSIKVYSLGVVCISLCYCSGNNIFVQSFLYALVMTFFPLTIQKKLLEKIIYKEIQFTFFSQLNDKNHEIYTPNRRKSHAKKIKMKLLLVAYSLAIDYADLITQSYKILEPKKKSLRTSSTILVISASVVRSIIHFVRVI